MFQSKAPTGNSTSPCQILLPEFWKSNNRPHFFWKLVISKARVGPPWKILGPPKNGLSGGGAGGAFRSLGEPHPEGAVQNQDAVPIHYIRNPFLGEP